jgi:hypothetical protein
MGFSTGPFNGFGFLGSVSPGAAVPRSSQIAAADHAGFCRIAPPGATPGRRTVIFTILTV